MFCIPYDPDLVKVEYPHTSYLPSYRLPALRGFLPSYFKNLYTKRRKKYIKIVPKEGGKFLPTLKHTKRRKKYTLRITYTKR